MFPACLPLASHADVLRGSSRVPAPRTSAWDARLPRIRHGNELTERDWENAVQGLGKISTKNQSPSVTEVEISKMKNSSPKIVRKRLFYGTE